MRITRLRVAAITAGVLLGGCLVAVAVYLRTMTRPRYVPQIDVPLWRGTGLRPSEPDPFSPTNHRDPRVAPPQSGDVLDDLWWPLPLEEKLERTVEDDPDHPSGLAGAVLGLAYATDETTARYWLAMCARRGATWEQQHDLWETWRRENARNVVRLHTDPTHPEEHP